MSLVGAASKLCWALMDRLNEAMVSFKMPPPLGWAGGGGEGGRGLDSASLFSAVFSAGCESILKTSLIWSLSFCGCGTEREGCEMGVALEGEAVTGGPANKGVGEATDNDAALLVAMETGWADF